MPKTADEYYDWLHKRFAEFYSAMDVEQQTKFDGLLSDMAIELSAQSTCADTAKSV